MTQVTREAPIAVTRVSWGRRANLVFLHGGRPNDASPTRRSDLPFLRVAALTWSTAPLLPRWSSYVVRNDRRGWNAGAALDDALRALDQVTADSDRPTVLVGHSMGARAALLAASERDDVAGVIALATWIEPADAGRLARIACPVVAAHGTADRITSPRSSDYVARTITAAGGRATYLPVTGENHSLTARPWVWPRLIARAAAGFLDQAGTGR